MINDAAIAPLDGAAYRTRPHRRHRILIIHAEGANQRCQRVGLVLQAGSGSSGFLDQAGILMGHVIHLRHCRIDLLDPGGLLMIGGIDFAMMSVTRLMPSRISCVALLALAAC